MVVCVNNRVLEVVVLVKNICEDVRRRMQHSVV